MADASGVRQIKRKKLVREVFREYQSQGALDLAFLLQDWEDAYNVGGMFRVADGCGASELILTGRTPAPPHPQIGVTSLGGHRRVPYRVIDRWDAAADQLKAEGYSLVAVEVAEGAIPYFEFEYPSKVCLILGNEANGVYSSLMQRRDGAVFIPMLGKGRSLNVHVAAAIVAFDAMLRPFKSSESP